MKTASLPYMQQKLFLTLFTVLLLSPFFNAQRHEVGVQMGMSNLVGDIGRTGYILQKPIRGSISSYGIPFYGSVLYRMNFNPYQSVRLNLNYSHIQFVDLAAKEDYRRSRKLWGTNSIMEADILFEYNLFPVNEEHKGLLSPYIFGGIGAMLASTPQMIIEHKLPNGTTPLTPEDFITTQEYTTGKNLTMAIPFGVGLKYKFNYNWALFGELMFRPTFSDAIDYSVISEKSVKVIYEKLPGETKSILQESPYKEIAEARANQIIKDRQLGNTNSKDWVNSISLGLSYSFGRPPCYCE